MEINHNKRSVQSSIRSYILKQIKWAVFMGIFGSEKKLMEPQNLSFSMTFQARRPWGLEAERK